MKEDFLQGLSLNENFEMDKKYFEYSYHGRNSFEDDGQSVY